MPYVAPLLRLRLAGALAASAILAACSGASAPGEPTGAALRDAANAPAVGSPAGGGPAPTDALCPPMAPAPDALPGVRPEHDSLDWWLAHLGREGLLGTPLASPATLAAHGQVVVEGDFGRQDLRAPLDLDAVRARIDERAAWMYERVADNAWFHADGRSAADVVPARDAQPELQPEATVRVVQRAIQVRCHPFAPPIYSASLDTRFNRNNCSTLRAQEPVRVLGRGPGPFLLVDGEYTWGWIDDPSALSAPLAPDTEAAFLAAPTVRIESNPPPGVAVERHGFARAPTEGRPMVVDATGTLRALPTEVMRSPTTRPLTREDFLRVAFSMAGEPYGWGGESGGRDCSRFLQDAFAAFGLTFPRFSTAQSVAGTFHVDVPDDLPESDRRRLLDVANEHGIVLLHFPGHIMLYLGRDDRGEPMGLHAFAEYVEPCTHAGAEPGAETLRTVDVARVSTLELGRGSSRRAFIERIRRITVVGLPPDERLQGIATPRAAAPLDLDAPCERGDATIFVSPARPVVGEPVRFVAAPFPDARPLRVDLRGPDGQRVEAPGERLGGPPFTWAARATLATPGTWEARVGDGADLAACVSFTVQSARPPATNGAASGPVWPVTRTWGPQTEAFYAAFVEKLFDYPLDEDVSWTNLQSVLQNEANNLLYNHFGRDEEHALRLEPDCADLPYFLRAYFAWKMGLPFSYRRCSRGRAGRPPECGEPLDNLQTRERADDVDAFGRFAQGPVRNTAHSSSGRTLPLDEASDFYPVAMTRDGIRPGTVYHDPYGHVMIVTRWVPQSQDGWGVLMAADAQPDKTIGRRRFWRGTFLFTPSTDDVGAGFKAWRPVVADRGAGTTRQLENAQIRAGEHVSARGISAFALDQYEGSLDDFYDRMDALINPRPLDAWSVQVSLIEALEESTVRRVQSIDTGEDWMRRNRFPTMEMPTGSSIFLTSGPWEDFSTPSRDMRLLVAIDAVRDHAARVRRQPERFDVDPAQADAAVAELERARDARLDERRFTYTRSDGSTWTLSLADVMARATALEMAYNPNDCPELRWGAPDGSDEVRTCRGRAPAAQRARMEEYRSWFRDRQRPAR